MSRINTNVNSLVAQRVLGQQNKSLGKSLERLSTGLKINRGADGPAGLIASEQLRSQKASLSAAIGNAERADQIANTAEGGLSEVQSMLTELQSLVSSTANETGLSTEEREANQLQVDQILQTIDRIAAVTSFGGTKLLNGGLDFKVSSVHANVNDFSVNAAKFETGSSVNAQVTVTASAQHAGLYLSTGGALDLTNADDSFVIEIGGADGTRQFSFASGTTATEMATAINQFKSVTGVSAAVSGGIVLKSTEYGSDQFVSFNIIDRAGQTGNVYTLSTVNEDEADDTSGVAFTAVTSPIRDEGQDVSALINGVAARGQGKSISVSTDALDISLELTTGGATATGSFTALSVTGGGAKFNLGASIDTNNQVRLGIGNLSSNHLGNKTDGYLSSIRSGGANSLLGDNVDQAQKVVNSAINQVSAIRGRIGAFQSNVVQSTINSLNVALENTSAAESAIRDTDFASETASLTRSQILVSAATNMLAIANSRPQAALSLIN